MTLHTARLGAIGLATISAIGAFSTPALADSGSISVRIGVNDGFRIGLDYRDDNDHRRPWPERIERNFSRLGGDHGDIRRAIDRFGALAHERPGAPAPRLGIAIGALLLGDDATGERRLRQVVADAPGALRTAPINHALHGRLHHLKEQYERRAVRFGDADAWFMVAALHVLTGHDGPARHAIRSALECGDWSLAAQRLAEHLGVRNDRRKRDWDRDDRRGGPWGRPEPGWRDGHDRRDRDGRRDRDDDRRGRDRDDDDGRWRDRDDDDDRRERRDD